MFMTTLYGKQIDLRHPHIEDVNFIEICYTLDNINRYTGAAEPNVSVAMHSLLVDDLARQLDPGVRPWAILHDFHEARIGDISTPVVMALGGAARAAIENLKAIHDEVIWAAAGIEEPDEATRAVVHRLDHMALKIEWHNRMATAADFWPEVHVPEDYVVPYVGRCAYKLFERLQEVLKL